jgi:MSV199 domain
MKNNFDIVSFIKQIPIGNFNTDYQNKLINKIKEKFPEHQQQLFIASFYCFLQYHPKKDFVVDFNIAHKWCGFTRKDNAKALLKKVFIENTDYKILLLQTQEQKSDNNSLLQSEKQKSEKRGGHNKEQIMMTVYAFKKFCLKAGTKKADEIHDYYINLEELLQETINDESDELRNQLLNKEQQLQIKDNQLLDKDQQIENNKKNNKLQIHTKLIEKFKNKRCIYVGEIEENNLIKIGSTKNTKERSGNLEKLFGNFIFLDIFECDNFRYVEDSIFDDPIIRENLYRKTINNHKSQEVVQLSEDFNYNQLVSIVKKYLKQTYFFTPEQLIEKQRLDLEKQKLEYDMLSKILNNPDYNDKVKDMINDKLENNINSIIKNYINNKLPDYNDNKLSNNYEYDIQSNEKIDQLKDNSEIKLEENSDKNDIDFARLKKYKPKGRKIQKIDPNDLKNIIKIYECVDSFIKSPENSDCTKNALDKAIRENKIYKNFRWNYVEKGEDPDISKVPETKIPKTKKIKQINPITKEVSIFNSFSDINKNLGICRLSIKNAIENKTITKGFLWEYENYNKEKTIINRKIKQINPITKEVIIFDSISSINKKLGISKSSIINAIENKIIEKGFLWEYEDTNIKDNNNINPKFKEKKQMEEKLKK